MIAVNLDIVKEKQNLTVLSWSRIRKSGGIGGSFIKPVGACWRQTIDDLTRREKLNTVKSSEKSKLFLRSEIMKRNRKLKSAITGVLLDNTA